MGRLAMILFSMVATSLAGIGIVIALTLGMDTLRPILIAAAVGFVLAIPATYVISRKIASL